MAFSSKPNTGTAAGKAQSLKDAQRTGGQISTQAKAGGGGNKQVTAAGLKAQSLEDDSETLARTPLPVVRLWAGRVKWRAGASQLHRTLCPPARWRCSLLSSLPPPTHGAPADAKISTELKTAIMKARTAKGLTQKQLAQQLNMQPQVINEYESGKGVPNNAIIAKIEKALGAKLPRVRK